MTTTAPGTSPVTGPQPGPQPVTAPPGGHAPRRGPWGRTLRRLQVHLANRVSDLLADDVLGRRLRVWILRRLGARVGAGSSLHGGTWISEPANLVVGRGCFLNRRCYLDLEGRVVLEDGVTLGHGVSVVTTHHTVGPTDRRCGPYTARDVHLGRGTWIGANATVLAGVRIGRGAVVAAGAVVTADVADDTVVSGVPARVVEGAALPDGAQPR